jgi:hypothetical protein
MSVTYGTAARGGKGAINYNVYDKTPMQTVNHSLRSITKTNATEETLLFEETFTKLTHIKHKRETRFALTSSVFNLLFQNILTS